MDLLGKLIDQWLIGRVHHFAVSGLSGAVTRNYREADVAKDATVFC
jgi:hypothetical protein